MRPSFIDSNHRFQINTHIIVTTTCTSATIKSNTPSIAIDATTGWLLYFFVFCLFVICLVFRIRVSKYEQSFFTEVLSSSSGQDAELGWECIDGRFNELLRSSLSKHTGADSFGESVKSLLHHFLPGTWFLGFRLNGNPKHSLTRFFCVWTQMVWTKLLPLIPVLIHQPGLSLIEEDPVGKSFSAGLWIVPVRVLATNVR